MGMRAVLVRATLVVALGCVLLVIAGGSLGGSSSRAATAVPSDATAAKMLLLAPPPLALITSGGTGQSTKTLLIGAASIIPMCAEPRRARRAQMTWRQRAANTLAS